MVGENFDYHSHWNSGPELVLNAELAKKPIDQWFSQTKFYKDRFDLSNPENTNFSDAEILGKAGSYIAMTWAKSTRVGCGIARCSKLTFSQEPLGEVDLQNGEFDAIFTVCRYIEAGNNQEPFFKRTFDQHKIAADCQSSLDGLCLPKSKPGLNASQSQDPATEAENTPVKNKKTKGRFTRLTTDAHKNFISAHTVKNDQTDFNFQVKCQ